MRGWGLLRELGQGREGAAPAARRHAAPANPAPTCPPKPSTPHLSGQAALLAHAQAQGYSELWVPRAILVTAGIPVLGSGKVDYPATTQLALTMRPLL